MCAREPRARPFWRSSISRSFRSSFRLLTRKESLCARSKVCWHRITQILRSSLSMTARPTIRTRSASAKHFGENAKVSVFHKENGGKAEALNFGWRKAKGEIVIALDADTLFDAADDRGARAPVCRQKDRRRRRQRKGRQPHKYRHQMAGARIRYVAEFRPPCVCIA